MGVSILQAVFSGLALGSIYALVALGFNITYNTTKTFNFGQGEFLVAGAFIAVSALLLLSGHDLQGSLQEAEVTLARYGLSLLATVVIMGVLGVILYYAAVRPFIGQGGLAWVMSTIGFGIIVQNIALAIWGPSPMVMPSPLGNEVLRIGGSGVLPQEILVLCVSIVLMLCLDVVMRKTRLGKAVRAVAQNGAAATLMGINVTAIIVLAFVVSASLAGIAGLLIAPITTASVFMGLTLALKAFSAAIVGGLSNPRGCMLGGFLLGLIEAMVGLWHAELREISMFLLIIFVLVLKPEGLLGQRVVEKV
jgi:branched-chain amino acid transport system permease protein